MERGQRTVRKKRKFEILLMNLFFFLLEKAATFGTKPPACCVDVVDQSDVGGLLSPSNTSCSHTKYFLSKKKGAVNEATWSCRFKRGGSSLVCLVWPSAPE